MKIPFLTIRDSATEQDGESILNRIDSNRFNPASVTPEFLSKTDPLLTNIQSVDGVFQSFFLTQGNIEIYPPNGLILPFQYMVA